MFDSRVLASGIQTGRSLAPQGPPIQEMLGMKMQQNQAIAEIMKELLKAHMTDISDLRKMQLNLYYKALVDPNVDDTIDPKTGLSPREVIANKFLNMDLTRFGALNSALSGGFGGKDTTGGGGEELLTPKTETAKAPSFMNRMSNFLKPSPAISNFQIPQGETAPVSSIRGMNPEMDSLMRGLKGKTATTTGGKDQYGHTIGEMYKGYKYIGNNQWQKS
jgi:hypothetical protein